MFVLSTSSLIVDSNRNGIPFSSLDARPARSLGPAKGLSQPSSTFSRRQNASDRLPLTLLGLLLLRVSVKISRFGWSRFVSSYQSLGGSVESMSVVSAELGVGTLERGVSHRLGLLDAGKLSADLGCSSLISAD